MRDFSPESELRTLIRNKELAILVGAGISYSASRSKCALWKGFLESGIDYCAKNGLISQDDVGDLLTMLSNSSISSFVSIGEELRRTFGGDKSHFRRWLEGSIGNIRATPARQGILNTVLSLSPLVLTTNYDRLLEKASSRETVLLQNGLDKAVSVLRGKSGGIIHLHGCYLEPDSVLLGTEDYGRHLGDQASQALQHSLFLTRPVLFLGFGSGLGDPNFRTLIEWLSATQKSLQHMHFQIVRERDQHRLDKDLLRAAHIRVVTYSGGYKTLPEFLASLQNRTPVRLRRGPVSMSTVPTGGADRRSRNSPRSFSSARIDENDLLDLDWLMLELRRGHPIRTHFAENRDRAGRLFLHRLTHFAEQSRALALVDELITTLNFIIADDFLAEDDALISLVRDCRTLEIIRNQATKLPFRKERGRELLNRFILGEIFPQSIKRLQAVSVLAESTAHADAIERLLFTMEEKLGFIVNFVVRELDEMDSLALGPTARPLRDFDIVLGYSYHLVSYAGRQEVLTVPELRKRILGSIKGSRHHLQIGNDTPQILLESEEEFNARIFANIWRESSYYWGPGMVEVPAGYPFAANTMILVYNRRLFTKYSEAYRRRYGKELQPPSTWEEFEQVAAFFDKLRTQKREDLWGVVIEGKREGRWCYYEWLNFAYGEGEGITHKECGWYRNHHGNIVLDSPSTIAATERYLRMARMSCQEIFAFEDCGHKEQIQTMLTKNVAMAIM